MRTFIPCFFLSILIGCISKTTNKKNNSDVSDTNSKLERKMDSSDLADVSGELHNTIVLSENKINEIDLPFPLKDMTKDLKSLFHECSIKKEIGKQDGPDFPMYSLKCSDKEIGFFAMHDMDTLVLKNIYIKDSLIHDQYKLKVGDIFSKIIDKRGKGKIGFDPYHFHMHYYFENSKISYELTGKLRTFDSIDIADIEIEEKDILDWKIEYIIWSKTL